MAALPIVIVGFGKIATDQHRPSIRDDPNFDLVAVVSERGIGPEGTPVLRSVEELDASGIAYAATAHCNTPNARFDTALSSIRAGKHAMLEKPPAATLAQLAVIAEAAEAAGVTLMTTWHSQANEGVERATAWLADKTLRDVRIDWHEDVRKWHPDQDWIWRTGGFGVFDPGINALSIATAMLPFVPYVRSADLHIPANRAMPIAADIVFGGADWDGTMSAGFDWRETEGECWQIRVDCDEGALLLSNGGRRLAIDGREIVSHDNAEYPTLYRRFASLIERGGSDVHVDPLRLVSDAFLVGERHEVEAFVD